MKTSVTVKQKLLVSPSRRLDSPHLRRLRFGDRHRPQTRFLLAHRPGARDRAYVDQLADKLLDLRHPWIAARIERQTDGALTKAQSPFVGHYATAIAFEFAVFAPAAFSARTWQLTLRVLSAPTSA